MNFPKDAKISARVHQSVKEKIDRSKYNASELLEYAADKITDEKTAWEVEEQIRVKRIEKLTMELIQEEKELEKIREEKKARYGDNLSELQMDSYHKILALYSDYTSTFKKAYDANKDSLEEFVQKKGIQQNIINDLRILDCPLEDYVNGLLDYYHNVRQKGQTA